MPDPFSLQDGCLAGKKGTGLAKWPSVYYTNIEKFLCQINKSSDSLLRLESYYQEGKAYIYYKFEFVKEIFYRHVSSESKYCILKLVLPHLRGHQILHTMFGQLLRKMVRDLEGISILHTVHVHPGFWDVVIMWQPCYLE